MSQCFLLLILISHMIHSDGVVHICTLMKEQYLRQISVRSHTDTQCDVSVMHNALILCLDVCVCLCNNRKTVYLS